MKTCPLMEKTCLGPDCAWFLDADSESLAIRGCAVSCLGLAAINDLAQIMARSNQRLRERGEPALAPVSADLSAPAKGRVKL